MTEYRVGIDPGITGALALLEYTGEWPRLVEVLDMPVMPLGKHHQINTAELGKILRQWNHPAPIVYLEQVHTMPGQGVSSQGNFMMGYGMIQGVVTTIGYPMILVTPQSWKKRAKLAGKKGDPDAARTIAQQFFPAAELGRKKDIGRADAILIAMFGK